MPWALLGIPLLGALFFAALLLQRSDGYLHIWVLDVGQGDATLVRTPPGRTVLVDGGPGSSALQSVLGPRLPFWQRNLDLIVASTPSDEHTMGLVDLPERYTIAHAVLARPTSSTTPATPALAQAAFERALAQHGVPLRYAEAGEMVKLEGESGVRLRFFAVPGEKGCISVKIEYGDTSALLMCDVDADGEAALVRTYGAQLGATALRAGKHGSASATTPTLLEAVRPRIALISAGAGNRWGYPSPELLARLDRYGITTYRTDQDGTIELTSDGQKVWMRTTGDRNDRPLAPDP